MSLEAGAGDLGGVWRLGMRMKARAGDEAEAGDESEAGNESGTGTIVPATLLDSLQLNMSY